MAENQPNYNDANPAAPAGAVNIKWQAVAPDPNPAVVRPASAYLPVMTSTIGGAVPTPPNDATKYLDGTGAYSVPAGAPPTVIAGINNQTASYTAVLGDAGKLIRMNVASANNFTVPPHSSVAFPVGAVITVRQVGAGITTIVAGAGVTISSPSTLAIARQNGSVQLVQVANDAWDLMGDVT